MRVCVLRSYGRWKPGDVFHPPDGVGNVLIRRGLVELAGPTASEPEVASMAAPERAVRRRGRPRKVPAI